MQCPGKTRGNLYNIREIKHYKYHKFCNLCDLEVRQIHLLPEDFCGKAGGSCWKR